MQCIQWYTHPLGLTLIPCNLIGLFPLGIFRAMFLIAQALDLNTSPNLLLL